MAVVGVEMCGLAVKRARLAKRTGSVIGAPMRNKRCCVEWRNRASVTLGGVGTRYPQSSDFVRALGMSRSILALRDEPHMV